MAVVRYTSNNRLKLLQNGDGFFPELIRAIDDAVSEIYLETYIFFPDEVGRRIIDALKRAVSRKVDVHVIIDWLGTGPAYAVCWQLNSMSRVFNIMFSTAGSNGGLFVCTGNCVLSISESPLWEASISSMTCGMTTTGNGCWFHPGRISPCGSRAALQR